jgi:methylated-DNA-[protein]-cysteine S-methyltransferase
MATPESKLESAIFAAIVSAPFGYIGVRTEQNSEQNAESTQITELVYLPPRFQEKAPADAAAGLAAQQIERYFADPDFPFSLPLKTIGSPFQQKVWQAISSIPRGQVRTYGQIAKHIQSAPRAVGQACGANWFPLVIPCHRVTASGGLGGFAHHDDETGFHLGIKRYLLRLERVPEYSKLESTQQQESMW